jgi:hypothetical protein
MNIWAVGKKNSNNEICDTIQYILFQIKIIKILKSMYKTFHLLPHL